VSIASLDDELFSKLVDHNTPRCFLVLFMPTKWNTN